MVSLTSPRMLEGFTCDGCEKLGSRTSCSRTVFSYSPARSAGVLVFGLRRQTSEGQIYLVERHNGPCPEGRQDHSRTRRALVPDFLANSGGCHRLLLREWRRTSRASSGRRRVQQPPDPHLKGNFKARLGLRPGQERQMRRAAFMAAIQRVAVRGSAAQQSSCRLIPLI